MSYQICFKHIYQASYCTRDSQKGFMALPAEVKHLKKKDAKRCGRKRKAALGNSHRSGNEHLVQQQASEGQVFIGEQCSRVVADLQTPDVHTMFTSGDLFQISSSLVLQTK